MTPVLELPIATALTSLYLASTGWGSSQGKEDEGQHSLGPWQGYMWQTRMSTHSKLNTHTPATHTWLTHLLGCSDGLLADICADGTQHWPPDCLLLHKT